MAAGGFVNIARFNAASSGTGDFVVSSAVTGYQTPADAGAVNATVYSYRAESADLSEWEIGEGAYTSGTTTLARTTVHESSNAGAAVNFSAAPQVAIVALAGDLLVKANNLSDVANAATAFGNIKQAASDSATGVLEIAVQSEMEAASSTTLAVTPGRVQYHPGAAKAWAYVTQSGGTYSVAASHNVSGVSKNGTGDVTVTFSTAFSSTNYCVGAMPTNSSNTQANGLILTASTFEVIIVNNSSTAVESNFMIWAFGDQ